MRVLLVSPDHPEALWLLKALQESAHSLQRTTDLRDGVFLAAQEPFDVIVVMSPERAMCDAALDALPQFVSAAGGASIVAVLGATTPHDRALMLRAGADACFGLPYSFIELHERMQALRRFAASRLARVPDGHGTTGADSVDTQRAASGLTLDAATRELVEGEQRMGVTRREYLLLECLLRQPNAPVPREQLIRYAWPESDEVDPSSVNLVVSRLRRKLLERMPRVQIETVSRYGYQINALPH
ncbi:response regulator transcription factor [Paraburkholderia sp.]|uniref:response regulator transcription factor n=1 Tax=Paraburkholderia sp. TaxID=1926495 RepID=UPI0023903B5D|nr:response regulator transcription factor [Paraburkholderia sp.]MDE1179269.1 response regulator transcription factor [Paraburkholderia sp.]